jgi:MFS family permease
MNRTLSHSETSRALRAFIYSSGMWGAWGQVVGIGTAVFTGYLLWLGATDAEVAYFVSIASFVSLWQVVASLIAPKIKRKKLFIFCVGFMEMSFRFLLILAPLFFPADHRILFVGILLGLALSCGNLLSPIYNGWLATVIPPDIRARFIGRQTMANLLAGMAAAYAAGRYVDFVGETDRYIGFVTAYGVATALGISGYINLMRVPFQEPEEEAPGNLLTPFRDRPFVKLLTFFLLWNFALGISSPFYSVFMLRVLQIDYATVALFNSLFMGTMMLGYRLMGGLVDRYGGKAVLQLLVPPSLLTPLLWVFNKPDAYFIIPIVMAITGLIHAGILVGVNTLLFGTLSEGRNKTTYFAAWSTAINMAYAVAPLIGSALVQQFGNVQYTWFDIPVGDLQLTFLVTSGMLVIPLVLVALIEDQKQTSPGELLAQVGRGNLLGYVYGALSFRWAENDLRRARAARQMGRSRSPMALDQLILALDDASPEVRRQAARGLGEAGSKLAIEPLLEELRDAESDIRSEAAEALGKIGDQKVIDPLVEALDDADTQVRISAIRALAEMGGEEARELLFWKFVDQFDRATFPTLCDVLGRSRDLRMVRPALERLAHFRSSAIRLQVFNSVCRTLGAGRRFYRLVSQDPLTRAEELDEMLQSTRQAFRKTRALNTTVRRQTQGALEALHKVFDTGEMDAFLMQAKSFSDYLEHNVDEKSVTALGDTAASRIGATVLAMRTFLNMPASEDANDVRMIFIAVCLWCLGDALAKR